MIIIILKILLAHFVGDFFLQPQKWVKHKEQKKLKSKWLYVHIAIHLVLMFLFIWDLSYALLILSIAVVHFIIDALKLILQKEKTKRLYFFIDQVLHIASIVGIAYLFTDYYNHSDFVLDVSIEPIALLFVVCLSFLTMPTAIIMRNVFSKWDISELTENNESLKDAGTYIGILERILVFIFIVVGHWEAVGFLITAKSVFRFGDLTSTKKRKLTEYVLIGTLISFGIAVIVSLIYVNLRHYV